MKQQIRVASTTVEAFIKKAMRKAVRSSARSETGGQSRALSRAVCGPQRGGLRIWSPTIGSHPQQSRSVPNRSADGTSLQSAFRTIESAFLPLTNA